MMNQDDNHYMKLALREAEIALSKDEVPIGAVIVCQNKIIARAHNLTETLNDVTAHAEMQAFTSAANTLGGKYLKECTLYVTLELCPMCAGAAYWTQIDRIVYAAKDSKRGYTQINHNMLHPKTIVNFGIMADEASLLISNFFKKKRKEK